MAKVHVFHRLEKPNSYSLSGSTKAANNLKSCKKGSKFVQAGRLKMLKTEKRGVCLFFCLYNSVMDIFLRFEVNLHLIFSIFKVDLSMFY
jgi:hypothetical protein